MSVQHGAAFPAHRLLYVAATPDFWAETLGVVCLLTLLPEALVSISLVFVHHQGLQAAATQSSHLQEEVAPRAHIGFGSDL